MGIWSALWTASAFVGAPEQAAAVNAAPVESAVSAPLSSPSVPAGTALVLETLEPLNSSALMRGDKFALRLAEPWPADGAPILAAGATGVGEVVHAQAAHSGGAPGELLLAARYLDIGGQRIPLRGYKLGASGKSNSGLALGASFLTGPFALFIRGREIEIPAHTRGEAKIAQDIALPGAEAVAPVPPPVMPNSPASTDPTLTTITSPEESP